MTKYGKTTCHPPIYDETRCQPPIVDDGIWVRLQVLGAENELGELIRFGFWQRLMPEEGENAFGWEGMRGPLDRVLFEIA